MNQNINKTGEKLNNNTQKTINNNIPKKVNNNTTKTVNNNTAKTVNNAAKTVNNNAAKTVNNNTTKIVNNSAKTVNNNSAKTVNNSAKTVNNSAKTVNNSAKTVNNKTAAKIVNNGLIYFYANSKNNSSVNTQKMKSALGNSYNSIMNIIQTYLSEKKCLKVSVKIIGKHVKLNCYTKIGEKEVSFEVPWKISYTNIKTFNDNSSGKINLSFLKNETNLQSNLIIPYDKINHKLIQIYMLIKKMENIKRDDIEEHSIKGLTKEDYELLILLVLGVNLRDESNKKYANQKKTLYEKIQAFLTVLKINSNSKNIVSGKKGLNSSSIKNDLSRIKMNNDKKNRMNQVERPEIEQQENNKTNNISNSKNISNSNSKNISNSNSNNQLNVSINLNNQVSNNKQTGGENNNTRAQNNNSNNNIKQTTNNEQEIINNQLNNTQKNNSFISDNNSKNQLKKGFNILQNNPLGISISSNNGDMIIPNEIFIEVHFYNKEIVINLFTIYNDGTFTLTPIEHYAYLDKKIN